MSWRGQVPFVAVTAALFLFLGITVADDVYRDSVTTKLQEEMAQGAADAVLASALTAPCATRQHGVFYRDALYAGSFRCLSPESTIYLSFDTGAEQYRWAVTPGETSKVRQADAEATITRTQTVTVYDADTGDYTAARMEVGLK